MQGTFDLVLGMTVAVLKEDVVLRKEALGITWHRENAAKVTIVIERGHGRKEGVQEISFVDVDL
jgi:hypothetical protein